SWLARSGARQGWARPAVSPDTTGTQTPGKGGSSLAGSATAGQEGPRERVRGAVEPSHEARQQRGHRTLIFFRRIVAYTTRRSDEGGCQYEREIFLGKPHRSVALRLGGM